MKNKDLPILHSQWGYTAAQSNMTLHKWLSVVTEYKSQFKLTKYTPYLALTGELWDVYC